MMFRKDFVAVVKCDGKILREDGEMVQLPFGSEYSILLKNLRSRKAEVGVTIDGQDVLNGHKLIISGNKEIELERFIEDLASGNKFKFIQKTQKIQEHRGDKVDDGILRIEFRFEKDVVETPVLIGKPSNPWFNDPIHMPLGGTWYCDTNCNARGVDTTTTSNTTNWATMDCLDDSFSPSSVDTMGIKSKSVLRGMGMHTNSFAATPVNDIPQLDEGITTKGSISTQTFKYGSIGALEDNSYVITLQLKGYTPSGNVVAQAMTVKTPKTCTMCGTNNKNTSHYCRDCGTYLD